MKTNKEYPATHSMSTAWYCVDEEGNVGVFDIDDNGPVPVGGYRDNCLNEVFWDDFSIDNGAFYKELMLKPDQIPLLLELSDDYGAWETDDRYCTNPEWMETILKIDMTKLDILEQALKKDDSRFQRPVCLSKEQGLFYVDFFFNKEGVDLLLQNKVLLAKYKAPYYDRPYDEEDEKQLESFHEECQKFPFFIYRQDYWPYFEPAIKVNNPPHPMKIEQLPSNIKGKIFRLSLRFEETNRIQLAEQMPVNGIWSIKYVFAGKIWWQLASSANSLIYYNEKTNSIIPKEMMDVLISSGEAEEFDWHKHKNIE